MYSKEERMRFAIRVKGLCEERNITPKELSAAIGIPNALMSEYLHGRRTPSGENFINMANYFGFTFEEFYDYTLEGDD